MMGKMILDHIFLFVALFLHYFRSELRIQVIHRLTNDCYGLRHIIGEKNQYDLTYKQYFKLMLLLYKLHYSNKQDNAIYYYRLVQ
jgi:hypothetical protein